MIRAQLGFGLLVIAVLATALGVVYAKHQSRKLFVQFQGLQNEQDRMDVQWGRLQLEQSTWATHGRIEEIARRKLEMHIPPSADIVIIRQ